MLELPRRSQGVGSTTAIDHLTGEGEILCFLDLFEEALTLLTDSTTGGQVQLYRSCLELCRGVGNEGRVRLSFDSTLQVTHKT